MLSNELDRMLIEHLGDLDDGASRMERLQEEIAKAIDDLIEEWATAKGWVTGEETWTHDLEAAVALPHWFTDEKKWLAWFELGFAAGDDGEWGHEKDYFWLTRLCQEGRGQIGFRFFLDEFGWAKWKKFLVANAHRLSDTRFILDDEPSLFLPVKVDKSLLAKGADAEEFSEALEPITEALNYIYEISERFEELRKNMSARQGS